MVQHCQSMLQPTQQCNRMANAPTSAPRKAIQTPRGNSGNIIQSPNPINILQSTAADVIVREVHDWELDVLTDGEQSDVKSMAFACLGVSAGFAQNAWALVANVIDKKPISYLELLFAFFCVAAICIGSTCWWFSARKISISKTLKENIRSRQLVTR